ncbi:MAG: hypothetical protein JW894_03825 [Bacteroidales bacterium]|nr:hypothetical protein [Bacteroidales bacterium]
MKRKVTLTIVSAIIFGFVFSAMVTAQTGSPIVEDNVIKVNYRHPQKTSNRYLDNNGRKKKLKTKIRMVKGWECPSYLHYQSKPQKRREKALEKRRKKLI